MTAKPGNFLETCGAGRAILRAVVAGLVLISHALAQESAIGPPPALQYPTEAPPNAPLEVPNQQLRAALERGADLALCEALMTEAGRQIPANFDENACEDSFHQKVANGEGVIRWAGGARPTKCGSSCLGRFFMAQSNDTDRPNLRRAMLYGRLTFTAGAAGVNRNIYYPFEIHATCKAAGGARTGDLVVDINFSEPFLGDPGTFESVLDFLFLPATISRRIETFIESNLRSAPGQSIGLAPCRSVGANRAPEFKFDSAVFEAPQAGPRFAAIDGALAGGTAKVTFHRMTRRPLPTFVDASHANAGNPAVGYFTIYLNGAPIPLPPPSPTPANSIELDPAGASVDLNYCRTISVAGADRLQIVFANALGAAAWSQFSNTEKFGAGAPRTITTGRTIVLPARPGPPDPVTGRPTILKPQATILNEFDLLYTVEYSPPPELAVAEPARPSRPGLPGRRPLGEVLGDRPILADPGRTPAKPCKPI